MVWNCPFCASVISLISVSGMTGKASMLNGKGFAAFSVM
jgi:hypothetical protein